MKDRNYKKEFISILSELIKNYPTQDLSLHLSLMLAEYPNFDSLSDKELVFLINKYKCEKDLDFSPSHNETEIERIIREAQDLEHILDDNEDDE